MRATNAPEPDRGGDSPGTLASAVYGRLRDDVLRGTLKPDQKLRIETLRASYGVGASPVREALNRLTSEGLVTQRDQKGFRVSPVSVEELVELTRARIWVTEMALREAIARGDAAWEERILLAFHRLARAIQRTAGAADFAHSEIEHLHRDFHCALIDACGSRWIVDFAATLFDFARRYQHLSMVGSPRRRHAEREHRAIMNAVLARNAELAVKLHADHISRTLELISKMQRLPNAVAKA